jgi:hypothetical protein
MLLYIEWSQWTSPFSSVILYSLYKYVLSACFRQFMVLFVQFDLYLFIDFLIVLYMYVQFYVPAM